MGLIVGYWLGGRRLELGTTYEVPIKFLNRELPIPNLFVRKEVFLWEGHNIAKGNIVEIAKGDNLKLPAK